MAVTGTPPGASSRCQVGSTPARTNAPVVDQEASVSAPNSQGVTPGRQPARVQARPPATASRSCPLAASACVAAATPSQGGVGYPAVARAPPAVATRACVTPTAAIFQAPMWGSAASIPPIAAARRTSSVRSVRVSAPAAIAVDAGPSAGATSLARATSEAAAA